MLNGMLRAPRLFAVGLTALLLATSSHGFIDPVFTPVDLVRSASAIRTGRTAVDDAGGWTLSKGRLLKGELPATIELSPKGLPEKVREEVARALSDTDAGDAVAYLGEFGDDRAVYLHAGNTWLKAAPKSDEVWLIQGVNDKRMNGTYNGATRTLLRITEYLLANKEGAVPTNVGTRWLDRVKAGQAKAPVSGMRLVRPLGTSEQAHVHVFGEGGDSLWRVDGDGSFVDVTKQVGLSAASRHAVWMRRAGVKHAILFSVQDEEVCIYEWGDGKLQSTERIPLSADCIGLAVGRVANRPAIVISTPELPLLALEAEGKWIAKPLPVGFEMLSSAGDPAAAVVADFNNDGYVDVLQPRAKHGLLWKGQAEGFAGAEKAAVTRGGSPAPAIEVGDWNADGRLDLFVSGPDASELWQQDHEGRFRPVLNASGSLSYKGYPGAASALATDLNHDGRPDLAVFYEKRAAPYHFNRGFGAMGEEGELPLDSGLVAAVAADMNGDSSLDLLASQRDGTLIYMSNDLFDVPSLSIRLADGVAGPVTVSVWQGKGDTAYCVGTVSVESSRPSVAALRKSGKAIVRWRLPGKTERSVEVEVGNKTLPFVIE